MRGAGRMTRPCPWCCDIRTTPDEPDGQPVDHDGRPVTRLAPAHPECVAELDAFLDQEAAT